MTRQLIVYGELLLQLSPNVILNNDELILNQYINSGTFSAVYSLKNNDDIVRIQHNKVENIIKEYEINGLKLQNKLQNCKYVCKLRDYGTYKIINNNLSEEILNNKISNMSPNIVDDEDIEDSYGYYSIMEKLNLSLIERRNKMIKPSVENFWLIKKITKQLLEFLEISHSNNIAHLDLKHENIMFNKYDDVRIIDFGFSCNIGSKLDIILGTPDYIAPEHYLHRNNYEFDVYISGKEDIWALGIIILELLLSRYIEKGCNNNEYIKLAHEFMYDKKKHLDNDIKEILTRYSSCLKDINVKNNFYDFLDMLVNMLHNNPENRFTATQCLKHPCFVIEGIVNIIKND